MYKDLENSEYDYVIIGTGICESILSSYLAKCGKKIIHFDISKYYGGESKNFSYKDMDNFFTELKMGKMNDPHLGNLKLVEEKYQIDNFYNSEKVREYNFDFNPKFLYGKSKATDELASTRASQYMEFVSVKKIFLRNVSNGKFMSVPCSKSDIFNSEDLQLFEKQKLLNFIHSVMKLKNTNFDVNTTVDLKKDYEVENKLLEEMKQNINSNADEFLSQRFSPLLQNIIKVVLANLDPNLKANITLDSLANEIYKYLNSLLVYDITPFIYPLYGSSEFSQALCRMASVFHTIFIVNEAISIDIFNNNEHLVDNSQKKFFLNIHDSNYDQSFSISSDVIICNENFLPQNDCKKLNFHDKIVESHVEVKGKEKFNQFISYYVVENNNILRNLDGPTYFKVPKNDPVYKNEFGFVAYEFDYNSYSAPRYRTLVQIIITSEYNMDENFISKCKNICDSFITHHIDSVREEIENKLSNMDTLDADIQKYIENNIENLHKDVNLLSTIQFYRAVNTFDFKYLNDEINRNIIVTENNYISNHLDNYFEDAEKIIKQQKWNSFEPIEVPSNFQELDESDKNDNLIDELFDSLELNK